MEVVIEVPMNNTLFVMMLQVGDGRAFTSSITVFRLAAVTLDKKFVRSNITQSCIITIKKSPAVFLYLLG